MTQFYLITGFLGAGKTTFLQGFLPRFQEHSVKLIINEFGNSGVDGSLLQSANAHLQEICGGSIFCTCKLDRFEEAMNQCLETAPDIILVEASGLSDPTNIRKVLTQYEEAGKLSYAGCICLVDAVRFHKVLETARVCKKQLAVADVILLNKTDLVTEEQLAVLEESIQQVAPFVPTVRTSFGKVELDLGTLHRDHGVVFDEQSQRPDITTQKMMVEIHPAMTLYQLDRFLHQFAEDTARIKGYVRLDQEGLVLADCVGGMIQVYPVPEKEVDLGLNLMATKGQSMRKALKQAIAHYPTLVTIIK